MAREQGGAETWDDRRLVAALRGGDEGAARELVRRFHPYLRAVAREAGVPAAEREAAIADALVEACRVLADDRAAVPRHLAAYLGTALRRRWLNQVRAERRRARVSEAAAEVGAETPEGAVAGTASEWALRASRGDAEDHAPHPVLRGLAAAMVAGLGEDERLLLAWLGHRVPQRLVAEWLGITPAAAAKRIARLRDRLRRAALAHAESLADVDRRTLLGFFRRAGTLPAPDGARMPRRARAPQAPQERGDEEHRS